MCFEFEYLYWARLEEEARQRREEEARQRLDEAARQAAPTAARPAPAAQPDEVTAG